MEVRKLKLDEHIKTKPLYREVFSTDSQGFVDYYYTEKGKDNQIYVMEDGENNLYVFVKFNGGLPTCYAVPNSTDGYIEYVEKTILM